MKLKLIFVLFIGIASLVHSQEYNAFDGTELRKYSILTEDNYAMLVYGPVVPSYELQKGFALYDEKDKYSNIFINPNEYKYISFINSDGTVVKLKSFPVESRIPDYGYKNVFMHVLVENSIEDLNNGKLDFYVHEFSHTVERNYGFQQGYFMTYSKRYYFKDLNGMHQIDYKRQFELFPKVLGKQTYRSMKRSEKDKTQFLHDYFIEYNRKIDKSLKTENSLKTESSK